MTTERPRGPLNDDRVDTDLPSAESAVGVWFDLERALEGTNGYGGNVAEIYAYRLLPEPSTLAISAGDPLLQERAAGLAARNLTWLVRHFVGLHEGVEIGIENGPREFRRIDLRSEEFPPFLHRMHIQVSKASRIRLALAKELLALRNRIRDAGVLSNGRDAIVDFEQWVDATKDLLGALGMDAREAT